jgi:ABC-type nitrate/sulfonate/bicarbonate transport system ATPase subunit
VTLAALSRVTAVRDGATVLGDVSLRIERGERVAIIGANGAGKTTVLRLLLGLAAPTSGEVFAFARGVGYVPQAYAESLFPWFSMLRNVAMPRLVAGREDALGVARRLCDGLLPGLDAARPAGRFSGGEKQAGAIARALAAPGEAVVADEPFSAIAAAARPMLREAILRELGGRALVLVTHDPEDVARLCDRAVRLVEGGVVETTTTARGLP